MYYSATPPQVAYMALIKNTPDFGVSRDQSEPGSLLENVWEGSGSREPGLRG